LKGDRRESGRHAVVSTPRSRGSNRKGHRPPGRLLSCYDCNQAVCSYAEFVPLSLSLSPLLPASHPRQLRGLLAPSVASCAVVEYIDMQGILHVGWSVVVSCGFFWRCWPFRVFSVKPCMRINGRTLCVTPEKPAEDRLIHAWVSGFSSMLPVEHPVESGTVSAQSFGLLHAALRIEFPAQQAPKLRLSTSCFELDAIAIEIQLNDLG